MKLVGLVLVVFLVLPGYSQQKDFQIWTSAELKTELCKKLDASFEEEFRFNENAGQLKKFFSQPGLSYKISKRFSAGIGFRYINQFKTDRTNSQRYYYVAELSYDNKFDRFRFKTRSRFVSKYSFGQTEETMIIPTNYLRQKFDLEYNIKGLPINPFISFEVFFPLNNPLSNYADAYRTSIGAEYVFNKHQSLTISFINDREVNVPNPLDAYVLALKFSQEF